MRVVENNIAVNDHVVALALLHGLVDAVPCAEVGPAEVAFHDIHVLRLLQYAMVYRHVGVGGEVLFHIVVLILNAEARVLCVELTQHRWQELAEVLVETVDVGKEKARVPVELAAVHEHLCELAVRLLRERLHLVHVVGSTLAQLNVAISRLRTCGFDTHRQQTVVLLDKLQTLNDVLLERLFVHDRLV